MFCVFEVSDEGLLRVVWGGGGGRGLVSGQVDCKCGSGRGG